MAAKLFGGLPLLPCLRGVFGASIIKSWNILEVKRGTLPYDCSVLQVSFLTDPEVNFMNGHLVSGPTFFHMTPTDAFWIKPGSAETIS